MRMFSKFPRRDDLRQTSRIGHKPPSRILPLLALSAAAFTSPALAAPIHGSAASENAMQGVLKAAPVEQNAESKIPAEALQAPAQTEQKTASETAPQPENPTVEVSDALRSAIETHLATLDAKTLLPELADMYAANNYNPVWLKGQTLSAQAKAAITRIKDADNDGLNAQDYALPEWADEADDAALAKAEIMLSQAVAAYAIHAQSGRINPLSISKLITAKPEKPSAPVAVMRVSSAQDAASMLESFNPPHPEFHALRSALKLERAKAHPATKPRIAYGNVLRPGQSDPRIPDLRVHLAVTAPADLEDQNVYDAVLVEAVKSFQKANNLKAAGILGRQTVDALNADLPKDNTAVLLVNMERWRWVPRDFGKFHIIVNVPEYMGRVKRDNETIHEMRVIVGSVKNQTPLFSHVMDHMVVNPYWHIPRSIATKEMLPKLRNDPSYLARQGIEVVRVANGKQQVVNSTMIDWTSTNISGLHFRQPPGERNALGRIKFMFPNEHAVYLHDTPSRNLFSREQRAMSHGCVRVHDPFALAEAIQGAQKGKQLRNLVGGSERRVNLSDKPEVHLVYFTRWVEKDKLASKPDIYGHDQRMIAALKLGK